MHANWSDRQYDWLIAHSDDGECMTKFYDEKDNLIFEQDLPETLDANYIGQILLNNSRIEIRPKKNVFTKELLPIKYLLS